MKKNKKTVLLITLLSLFCSAAQADELGGELELGVWNTKQKPAAGTIDHKGVFMMSGQFEHPMPIIPNIRFDALTLESGNFAVSQSAFTGFYHVLDNDYVGVDVGVGVTVACDDSFLNGNGIKKSLAEIDDAMPHIYVGLSSVVPYIDNLSVFSNYYRYGDSADGGYDIKVGAKYSYTVVGFADLAIKAGYRKISGDFLRGARVLNSGGAFVSVAVEI